MKSNRVIRVPEHLISLANHKSKRLNISTNKYIIDLIERDLSEDKQDRIIAINNQQIVVEEIKNNLQYTMIDLFENQKDIMRKLNVLTNGKE